MNKYLVKIAETATKDLPYRDRVEVVITKGDTVLITKNKNKDTGEIWYGYPGGGLDGDSPKTACTKECLEEVGIKIKNIKDLGIEHKQEGIGKKDDRHLKFRGSITRWYSAEFDEVDKSKQGADGDSRKYAWESHQDALRDVGAGKVMSSPRKAALKALKASK